MIQILCELYSSLKRDKASLAAKRKKTGRKLVAMQGENIKGWQKGLFGRQVQNSALGTLKIKLMSNPHVLVIDRFFPSCRRA